MTDHPRQYLKNPYRDIVFSPMRNTFRVTTDGSQWPDLNTAILARNLAEACTEVNA